MKRSTMNLMLAAAALTVASTVASAQVLKAEIPFAFQTSGKAMAAGTYSLTATSGESMFQLINLQSGNSILLASGIPVDPQKEWLAGDAGVLQFDCSDSGCTLRRVWTHRGVPAREFAPPKGARENSHLAVIRLVTPGAKSK